MGLFNRILKKEKTAPRGFVEANVRAIRYLCGDTIEISFDTPEKMEAEFQFTPGQYINIAVEMCGEIIKRSYSISSSPAEGLTLAVKRVESGVVSNYLFDELQENTKLWISKPEGRFVLPKDAKNCVAFAAGSGITPVLSIAKSIEEGSFRLFYGSKDSAHILYEEELKSLPAVSTTFLLSREEKDGFEYGRIDKDYISNLVRSDLSILKSDAFLVCGPEEMIVAVIEGLKVYGISEDKIVFELFTTPTLLQTKEEVKHEEFDGTVSLHVQLDGDVEEMNTTGKLSILDAALNAGLDAPYSCRGGVCSTCRCKLIEGSATMRLNYVLTDQEVEDGWLLSCQATPTSSTVKITYDV